MHINRDEAVNLMGVSVLSSADAAKVKMDGLPEPVDMVKSGEISPNPAAQAAKSPAEEQ